MPTGGLLQPGWSPCTKTQPLLWCQREVENDMVTTYIASNFLSQLQTNLNELNSKKSDSKPILVGGKKTRIENGGSGDRVNGSTNGRREEASSDYAMNPALTSPDMVSDRYSAARLKDPRFAILIISGMTLYRGRRLQ